MKQAPFNPTVPTLLMTTNRTGQKRWALVTHFGKHADKTIYLYINHHYGYSDNPIPPDRATNHYSDHAYEIVLVTDIGEKWEVVSEQEFNDRFSKVEKMEEWSAANEWAKTINFDERWFSIGQELIARWEAMLTLGLFNPHVV